MKHLLHLPAFVAPAARTLAARTVALTLLMVPVLLLAAGTDGAPGSASGSTLEGALTVGFPWPAKE